MGWKSPLITDMIVKTVASICFVLIAVALVVINRSPATGYESSIYWSTPPLVWGCLLFAIICGIAIVVHQAYRREERSNLWAIGFILILLSSTIVMSLHILRGYTMWNASGDSGSHLGMIQAIIASGHFERSELYYPTTHTYLAQLSLVSGASPVALTKWVPVFIGLLYSIFMYFLARSVLRGKSQVMLATVAAMALPLSGIVGLIPNSFANLTYPLALLFLFKSLGHRAWQWKALLILTAFLFPVFHQIPAVALAIMLITVPLVRVLLDRLGGHRHRLVQSGLRFSTVSLVILLVWGSVWLFPLGQGVVRSLVPQEYSYETGQTGQTGQEEEAPSPVLPSSLSVKASHLTRLIAQIEYAQHYGYSIAEQFFRTYGSLAVYILLALAAVPILWRRRRGQENDSNLISLYGPLVVIALLTVALYFGSIRHFAPPRFLPYIAIICTLFAGFTLHRFMDRTTHHKRWLAAMAAFAVSVLLAGLAMNSIGAAYPSPYKLYISYHTTQAEIDGMDWFLRNKDTAIDSAGWYFYLPGYAFFLLTPEERVQREDVQPKASIGMPLHLGYDKNPMMGQSYEEDTYVVLRELNRKVYVDVYPRMAESRLLPSDFDKMETDPTLDKLYDNTGLDIWRVHARH